MSPAKSLGRLAAMKGEFGPGTAVGKLELLRILEPARLLSAAQVRSLHETLCFLAAYPDNEEVFAQVERMLKAFEARADLALFRRGFENSGMAGTDLVYPFSASTARWLTDRWPRSINVAWGHDESVSVLEARLPHFSLWSERAVFDEPPLGMREWIERLRGAETDATFLVQRSAACAGTSLLGDQLYDELGLTLVVHPGPGTPSRTLARLPRRLVCPRTTPLQTGRPDIAAAVLDPPRHISDVAKREAHGLIDLAREAMATRKRDLYSFAAADHRDVRIIDAGDGLEFACVGVVPEQRLLLEAVYGFLMLRNGVPIGYALTSALWRSSEIAFNMFDTFRGGESGFVYGRLLAVMRALFGVDTFTIYPYQLGHENDEGLESGAWWFYYKMGFRPKDPAVAALARHEAGQVATKRGYRTSVARLRELVRAHLFLHLGDERDDVIGVVPADAIALRCTDVVAKRFGSDRERATTCLADEAASTLGAGAWRQWTSGERLLWERWAPLVASIPGLGRWAKDDRAALVELIRIKGGQRESDFVNRFDAHPRLGPALLSLATHQTSAR
jgi:hypothetical protein